MNGLLDGKRIVVTGAARGLGYSFAAAIAAAGAQVVMCDILADELAASGAALREQGARVETQTIDLASPDSIRLAFEKIAAGGGIDGLVNNAALATGVGGKTMMEYDIDLWDRVMQVNVRGTWLVSQAAVPLLARNPHAKIVNVASDTALWGAPRLMAYVASKGAVIAMTRSMARELGPQGICVNAIAPGPGGRQPNPDHLYRGGVIMQHITDFNPWLPDTQQVTPAREGGNGQIHQPGQFRNVIWQNRARVPDGFETALVAALETIFDQGAEELEQIVSALNQRRLFDRSGQPWNEATFREFLHVNGF